MRLRRISTQLHTDELPSSPKGSPKKGAKEEEGATEGAKEEGAAASANVLADATLKMTPEEHARVQAEIAAQRPHAGGVCSVKTKRKIKKSIFDHF